MTGDLWERYLKIIENENVSDGLVIARLDGTRRVADGDTATQWTSSGASGTAAGA